MTSDTLSELKLFQCGTCTGTPITWAGAGTGAPRLPGPATQRPNRRAITIAITGPPYTADLKIRDGGTDLSMRRRKPFASCVGTICARTAVAFTHMPMSGWLHHRRNTRESLYGAESVSRCSLAGGRRRR